MPCRSPHERRSYAILVARRTRRASTTRPRKVVARRPRRAAGVPVPVTAVLLAAGVVLGAEPFRERPSSSAATSTATSSARAPEGDVSRSVARAV